MKRIGILLGLVLGGCGPRVPESYQGPPEVELGTGYERFVEVKEGDAVPIIHGLQGGYHIWGSVRIRYMDPYQLHLRFTLTRVGQSAPLSIRDDHVDLAGTRDGTTVGEHLASAVFLPSLTSVLGQPCVWHLDVTDLEGRKGAVERKIVPSM